MRAEMTLADMEKNAGEIKKLVGVLETASTVCHDLNQPLMAVSAYSEVISMQLPGDDPLQETMGKMTEQVEKMGMITRKLMRTLLQEPDDDLAS
jgi:phosphoglycerate-specific signal transduction histidine kinase